LERLRANRNASLGTEDLDSRQSESGGDIQTPEEPKYRRGEYFGFIHCEALQQRETPKLDERHRRQKAVRLVDQQSGIVGQQINVRGEQLERRKAESEQCENCGPNPNRSRMHSAITRAYKYQPVDDETPEAANVSST